MFIPLSDEGQDFNRPDGKISSVSQLLLQREASKFFRDTDGVF